MSQENNPRGKSARKAYEQIDALIKSRDLDKAEQALAQAGEQHGHNLRYQKRAYQLARLRKDKPAIAAALDRRIALGDASPDLATELTVVRFRLGDVEGARAAADSAGDISRDVLNALIAAQTGDEGALREAMVRVEAEGGRDRLLKGRLATLISQLPVAGAVSISEDKRGMAALSGVLPPPEALRRPLVVDDASADVITSPEGDSDTIAVILTGLQDRMQYPITVLDHYFAALGVTTVYLRDFDRLLYWNGVRSWGGPEAMAERIRGLAGDRKLVIAGGSGGGWAAMRWGVDIGADRIVVFSPPTNLVDEFRESIGDSRGKMLANRLRRHIPLEDRDLAPRVAATGGRIPIHIVFGNANAVDAAHANNLADIPGVHLHPMNTGQHLVLNALFQEGEFETVLAGLLGVVPPGGDGSAVKET